MFKLYPNKSSLLKRTNRYINGGKSEPVNNTIKWWERITIPTANDDISFTITKEFENRADAISFLFYGSDAYDWIVLQFNNIVDTQEELAVGKTIRLPSKTRVVGSILTKSHRNG